jgi:hypothetical protein
LFIRRDARRYIGNLEPTSFKLLCLNAETIDKNLANDVAYDLGRPNSKEEEK